MRCFIAIDVNDAVRDAAMQTVEKLKKRGFRASWVKRENVHLTLFFLGEVQPRQVDEIAQHLCRRVRGFPSFSFVVEKVGCFKKGKAPRVFWMGVESRKALSRLYEEMRGELSKHGFSFEERFAPHITLGRIKDYPVMWDRFIEDINIEPIVVGVDRFSIYSSKLTPSGPIYKCVYECRFEGGLIKNE